MDTFVVMVALFVVPAFGAVLIAALRLGGGDHSPTNLDADAVLATARGVAEEDVARFGEELQRLDRAVDDQPLDAGLSRDWSHALDAHGHAREALAGARRPDDVRQVTFILEDGRHALACVRARLEGRALPQRRPPCFFNPAHGPSVAHVWWTPPAGAGRDVPACAADADRVRAGADPNIRTVAVGGERVPYWDGGRGFAPWIEGYYRRWPGSPHPDRPATASRMPDSRRAERGGVQLSGHA